VTELYTKKLFKNALVHIVVGPLVQATGPRPEVIPTLSSGSSSIKQMWKQEMSRGPVFTISELILPLIGLSAKYIWKVIAGTENMQPEKITIT